MKDLNIFKYAVLFFGCTGWLACTEPEAETVTTTQTENAATELEANLAPPPVFNVALQKIKTPNKIPGFQSFAWARQGNKLLVMGGRIEGFHGLTDDNLTFKTSKANTSIWVIDFSDYSVFELALDADDENILQFSSSNMEFYQDADTLFLVGGYGRKTIADEQSNYTFDRMVAVQVSAMIAEVEKGDNGNPGNGIIKTVNSPYLQVTGGALHRKDGVFYLMFGQDFNGAYTMGVTGKYTNAIRQFKWVNSALSDTSSIIDESYLHRRDLSVVEVQQAENELVVGYGGAFTKNGNGFANPVRMYIKNGKMTSEMDAEMVQKTSQYDCAVASVYDTQTQSNTHVFFGGIGRYQYHEADSTWEDGDNGALLPFVKTITQMTWQNDSVIQRIQIPPTEPQLPALLGANAIFFANPNLIYQDNVIDFQKCTGDTTSIGFFFGGIKSDKPTSSMIYPTSVNNTLYEVLLIVKRD